MAAGASIGAQARWVDGFPFLVAGAGGGGWGATRFRKRGGAAPEDGLGADRAQRPGNLRTDAAPDFGRHMRPAAASGIARALLCRVLQTCEPCCKRVGCDTVVQTPQVASPPGPQRKGRSERGFGSGLGHAASRFREAERPSGAARRPAHNWGRKWTPTGLAPHRGVPGVVPPGKTASQCEGALKGRRR